MSFYLNGKIHTELELSNREVSAKLGSLCGMSAIYQAAVDTFFTVFQLKNMTLEEIKQEFYIHMSLDPVADKFKTDQDLLEAFHNCKCFLDFPILMKLLLLIQMINKNSLQVFQSK